MKINYEEKSNKFVVECTPAENNLVMAIPDRRYRKATRAWAVPVLRRNIEYLDRFINNPQFYSKEALQVFNTQRKELKQQPQGENTFPSWYQFKNEPLKHQGKALHKFFPLNAAGILFEQGLGKTFTSINLATAWRMTNHIDSVVVVCPSSIKLVWNDELDKHCPIPTQRCALISGKYAAVERFIDTKTDFQWLIVGVEGLSQGKAYEYVKSFMLGRRCVMIVDESSRIKTPNKMRTDNCIKLGKMAKKRLILSGTSVTQGLEDLYTQFKFLDPNIIGYESYYSFRAQYCVVMNMTVGYNNNGNERTVQKIVGYKNEDELMGLLRPYVERVEKADALDLPPKTFVNRYITMNPTQKRIYNEMKEDLMLEVDNTAHEVTSVLEQMLRLQQITGGHYPWDNGEKIVPVPIPGNNPKVEELMDLMDEITGKVIVWCQFRPEIALVAKALEKAKIGFVQFHGGCKDAEKQESVTEFKNNPKVKVFLATRAAAYGLTLTEASTAIYFSQGYSLEEYAQSQDRIHRIGALYNCNYVRLVCDNTIDVKIIKALDDKKSVADLIYSLLKSEG